MHPRPASIGAICLADRVVAWQGSDDLRFLTVMPRDDKPKPLSARRGPPGYRTLRQKSKKLRSRAGAVTAVLMLTTLFSAGSFVVAIQARETAQHANECVVASAGESHQIAGLRSDADRVVAGNLTAQEAAMLRLRLVEGKATLASAARAEGCADTDTADQLRRTQEVVTEALRGLRSLPVITSGRTSEPPTPTPGRP